ncbi:hypothetical protein NCS52_01409100 [Fusarium sp. LHS14.1]|nr:hypothetical protein NCS52_01409100 [Fusarium sp. LHS14.1]
MPSRRPARRVPLEGLIRSPRSIESKRLRLLVRTDEGDKPTQVELDFLPSYSPDDGALRIKVGRNSDGKRSIGWINHPESDTTPPLHRETVPGVVDVFPGGRSTMRDNRISLNIIGALFAIFIILISNPPNADPLHNQDPWNWGIEVKSLLAQPGTSENTTSFDPAYNDMFHKYTVSYDPPLVGDLMSAVSQLGYSSRHVLVMPFFPNARRKSLNPDNFFESLAHGLDMVRPHRLKLARISHENAKYYPSFVGMHRYTDDLEQDGIKFISMPRLFDELDQLGDNMTKTIGEPDANSKVINLFEAFLSPGSLIQKFPDELDKYLLTLTRDLRMLSDALELPSEISMLLMLEKRKDNRLSLQEIISEGSKDPT